MPHPPSMLLPSSLICVASPETLSQVGHSTSRSPLSLTLSFERTQGVHKSSNIERLLPRTYPVACLLRSPCPYVVTVPPQMVLASGLKPAYACSLPPNMTRVRLARRHCRPVGRSVGRSKRSRSRGQEVKRTVSLRESVRCDI